MGWEYNEKVFPVHTPFILHPVLVGAHCWCSVWSFHFQSANPEAGTLEIL
jgi:hypothetical protein